jgi:predicted nucleic acid-binding protein
VILADTSIWIGYFRINDAVLAALLNRNEILMHDFIIGELALGDLRQREVILDDLRNLPRAAHATDFEVMHSIERENLSGLGIGYIDAHLLAAARLTPDCLLWTRDKRLRHAARRLALEAD